MMLERLDEEQTQRVMEIAALRLQRVPRRGGMRQITRPYPTYVLFSTDKSPEHAGWEVLAFDGEIPIASIEVAVRDGELRWVNTTSGILPSAIVEAAYEAESLGANASIDFGVVRAPEAGMSLLWLETGEFIPLRVPHLREELPTGALSQFGVHDLIERVRSGK